MKKRTKVTRFVTKHAYESILKYLYLTGITIIIPLILLLAFREIGFYFIWTNRIIIMISAACITVSVIGFYVLHRNKGKMFKKIGFVTLIPATLSILFLLIPKRFLFNVISYVFPALNEFLPYLDNYIQYTVPKIGLLTLIYLSLGAGFYLLGRKF